jgi:Zn finger protein HypA/HybF involved in hydrogenase expression
MSQPATIRCKCGQVLPLPKSGERTECPKCGQLVKVHAGDKPPQPHLRKKRYG